MSNLHKCHMLPKNVKSISRLDDGWHVQFSDSFWRSPISFCPFCGKKLEAAIYRTTGGFDSGRCRAVRCIDTGEVFSSIAEAARSRNISDSSIIRVCKGRGKTANGEKWEFIRCHKEAK